MKNLFLLLIVLIPYGSFAQNVDQTFIDENQNIVLFAEESILSFDTPEIGSLVMNFHTLTPDLNPVSMQSLCDDAIADNSVLVFTYGSLSCPALQNLMNNVSLDLESQRPFDIKVVHILPTIEAHASNGYQTPYFWITNGQISVPDQIPEENIGLNLPQPWTMGEYLDASQSFVPDMFNLFGVEWYSESVLILDSPEGGFTEWFKGPAGLIVVDPLSKELRYSESFILCGINGHEHLTTINDAIDDVLSGMETVGVSDNEKETTYSISNDKISFSKKVSGQIITLNGKRLSSFQSLSEIDLSPFNGMIIMRLTDGLVIKVVTL